MYSLPSPSSKTEEEEDSDNGRKKITPAIIQKLPRWESRKLFCTKRKFLIDHGSKSASAPPGGTFQGASEYCALIGSGSDLDLDSIRFKKNQ